MVATFVNHKRDRSANVGLPKDDVASEAFAQRGALRDEKVSNNTLAPFRGKSFSNGNHCGSSARASPAESRVPCSNDKGSEGHNF